MLFRSFPAWETNTTSKSGRTWRNQTAATFIAAAFNSLTTVLASGSAFIQVVGASLDPDLVDPINVESTPGPQDRPPSTGPTAVSYLPRVLIAALLAFAAILIPASIFFYRSRQHQRPASSSSQQQPSPQSSSDPQDEAV